MLPLQPPAPRPYPCLRLEGEFQSGGFYRPLGHSSVRTPVEKGKGNSISQAIVGPSNMLLSGGNVEHFGSQGQTAYSVEISEFLERYCFSVSDTVLTAHGGGEGLACRSGIEATFPEQPAQIRVFLKELTNIMKQNAWVPTAHDKHSSQGRNTDAE